ncbi:MAG: DUF1461 domain-containing protein [Candidatus Curtissbacteria bacterium]
MIGSLRYLLIILIPVVIILANLNFLIFNKNFYETIYKNVGTYQNFENGKIVNDATNNLFRFFKDENDLDTDFFSQQAAAHLEDVKILIKKTLLLFYLSLGASAATAIILISKKHAKKLADALMVSSIVTIIFMAALQLGFFTIFDKIFIQFHRTVFTNDLWFFSSDDNLIKLFPQTFFVEFANRLALNIVISSAIIIAVSYLSLRRAERRSNLKP